MEAYQLVSYFTLDERLAFHQKCLEDRIERLKGDLSDEDRQIIDSYKKEEEVIIERLEIRKQRLLEEPRFLLLIATTPDYKVFKILPTYIETEFEAKHSAGSIIRKLLADNNVELDPDVYLAIIVRKSFYEKEEDKINVSKFNTNRDVYVTDKEMQVTNEEINII